MPTSPEEQNKKLQVQIAEHAKKSKEALRIANEAGQVHHEEPKSIALAQDVAAVRLFAEGAVDRLLHYAARASDVELGAFIEARAGEFVHCLRQVLTTYRKDKRGEEVIFADLSRTAKPLRPVDPSLDNIEHR